MPTALGWNLITLPAFPAVPSAIEFADTDVVGVSTSPFTGQQQIQDWQAGTSEWSVTYQTMKQVDHQPWEAALSACRGPVSVFQLGHPLNTAPSAGLGTGSMTVNGANQAGYLLSVTGYTGTLSPGDYIQIGYRLHRVITPVTGAGGAITLSIWPPLRESPANGAAVILTNTQGLWRLKANTRKWALNTNKTYSLQFEIREAL